MTPARRTRVGGDQGSARHLWAGRLFEMSLSALPPSVTKFSSTIAAVAVSAKPASERGGGAPMVADSIVRRAEPSAPQPRVPVRGLVPVRPNTHVPAAFVGVPACYHNSRRGQGALLVRGLTFFFLPRRLG